MPLTTVQSFLLDFFYEQTILNTLARFVSFVFNLHYTQLVFCEEEKNTDCLIKESCAYN